MASAPESEYAVIVEDLRIDVSATGVDVVDEVSFRIRPGEVLGLVGESGSGKTTVGLAMLGHARRGVRVAHGRIVVAGHEVLSLRAEQLRALRGATVSYVPQDPGTALNPNLRIGQQILEVLQFHKVGADDDARRARVAEALGEVALPSTNEFLRRYPHQLSGGQQQRVGLAMAFACRPRVLVLDEPTTGLDVTTQAHVLGTVRDLCGTHGVAALYVSHDLAVIADLADRVALLYAGRLVELGPKAPFFHGAAHPYARRLIQAIPEMSGEHELRGIPGGAPRPGSRPQGCFFAPRCDWVVDECRTAFPPRVEVEPEHDVRCYRWQDVLAAARADRVPAQPRVTPAEQPTPLLAVNNLNASYGVLQVLHGIDLRVEPGECVALVGESGSGKTTLARCIGGLHRDLEGEILLNGEPLAAGARSRSREVRRQVQYVFQSPYASLNPRKTIGQSIGQPLRIFEKLRGEKAEKRVIDALERVSLGSSVIDRYPDQLSGGERQRVAIARAIAVSPSLLVCDEVTSALDVSVQAAVVGLIAELQRDLGLGLVFVTHNLALISTIASRVAVLSAGRIVEQGPVRQVLTSPSDDYTRRLLSDTPTLEEVVS
ncbi:MAG TPA: ABC transporter ATP-binding protein [Gaiellales bacterium]|jgi:peptide/nickel transport system ATP-binding protein